MKEVRLVGVQKTYPASGQRTEVRAVRDVDLTIPAGNFFVLLGSSGSGKTTLMRCIAGLEETTGGEIYIGDDCVASRAHRVPPAKRNIGMVFQDYAVWPHMTVAENVGYALRHARRGALRGEAARKRVAEILELVGLSAEADRGATYLSGGQQQRVAVARAIVGHPDCLLFDEPLSNLDAKLRAQMRVELRRITTELGITSVYVTHDQVEALTMADQIAVMRFGEVRQIGSPQDIYRFPADEFVASFIGEANLVSGRVRAIEAPGADGLRTVTVETGLGTLCAVSTSAMAVGETATLVVRPANLHLANLDPHRRTLSTESANVVTGVVESAAFAGAHTELELAAGSTRLRAQIHSFEPVAVGTELQLSFSPRWTTAIPTAGLAGDGGAALRASVTV